jgi:uncharacterized protein
MAEIGYLESDSFPPVIAVHEGDPKPTLRLYHKGQMALLISEIPVHPGLFPSIARSVVEWSKSKDIELLISLSGIAIPNRLEIEVPEVYGVASSASVKVQMKDAGVTVFEEGFISGPHASIMKESIRRDLPMVMLLAQCHLRYPDPGAAVSVINTFNRLVGWKVDTEKLVAQQEEIRMKTRELMQRTQQTMQQGEKGMEQEIPSLYV